jgi:hypothetical protein
VSKRDKMGATLKREKTERALSDKFNAEVSRGSISGNKSRNERKRDPTNPG